MHTNMNVKSSNAGALDELFVRTAQYKNSQSYFELLQFVSRFHFYSAFNAMLAHIQMPGARYVLRAKAWWDDYRRTIRPGARPLIMLQPMGPVMFVYDVSDTEGAALPDEIEKPFEARSGELKGELEKTMNNAKRDGVLIHSARLGSQRGGSIRLIRGSRKPIDFDWQKINPQFELELNQSASRESQYATLAHELGHLYCGHLGTPNEKWWPSRFSIDRDIMEIEAESVAYIVCKRAGLDTPSERYLSGYVQNNDQMPDISLDSVMKAAILIEKMGKKGLQAREKPSR